MRKWFIFAVGGGVEGHALGRKVGTAFKEAKAEAGIESGPPTAKMKHMQQRERQGLEELPMAERHMTKSERDDLCRLVKQRERVAKTAAEQRSAAMLAEFEQQVSAVHQFNNNDVWKAATEAAIEAANKANETILAEADRLGIPKEFQPKLSFHWARRGENEYRERRDELRRLAKAEIDALEKVARVQIESESVRAQTEIIANGLNSEAALEFLNRLPAIDSMMPALDVTAIQAKLAERARRTGYQGLNLIETD